MKKSDLVDKLQKEWHQERPDLYTASMGIVGRFLLLGELLKKRANQVSLEFGIGYTDLDVLATLKRSGKPYQLRPADLLNFVLIKSGSLTACLDRLEKAQLITRAFSENDRRSRFVMLTDKSKKLVDQAIEKRFKEASEFLLPISKKEQTLLEPILKTLLSAHMNDEQ
ncbi:MarR family winged helix-turn-helix transcriptional regulator [Marinicella sp. W31]|uniref:MarR family winged helix-turn-helix transcriptional regulator n=1 Tax=Marinicella sp. W31 TaxID=3023713 RepID=UPI00375768E6